MRITYRHLISYLNQLHDDQLDCDVTVEIDNEWYGADFRITGEDSDAPLDINHPVIFVYDDNPDRATLSDVDNHIRSIKNENGFGPLS